MSVCPSCSTELPDGSRFCLQCGTPLAAPAAHPEERKVVTTFICDLVGSTAIGEAADPEDVDRLLRRYNALARQVVESHGGVVEKFIGDAVVAVFGVPVVHEDDPERAVRAGLRLIEAVEDLAPVAGHPVQVRIGINTGEALVRLDVTPGSGEGFLTGDAVNTAARLQGAAPPMGVVAGSLTHELTRAAIVYEALGPVVAKGKREPLDVWLATEPVSRTGADSTRDFATTFVGRTAELESIKALFRETVTTSSSRFALLLGEPGIGKSRLVAEFGAWLDDRPELVTWRQGRCLPYGEGVTFWALGEMVKATAGVLEGDDPATAGAKLDRVIPEGLDRAWLANRLRPLLGLEATEASREENFAAWQQFLEHLAASGPAVLVFEDLHWADEAMLAFLEHLGAHLREVPLLLIATARPTLFERRADFAAAIPLKRVDLVRLADDDTARLMGDLLEVTKVPAEIKTTILERCGGNPLYVEEYVRLLRDRGLLLQTAGEVRLDDGATLPLPESIQAVIAARLDMLPPEGKSLLADASVIGRTFWSGALAALGERAPDEVERGLERLLTTELIRPARSSSMAGEAEYVFWHALARDVAYGELPRTIRARKHVLAGDWLESKAGGRAEDVADVLAHHYVTALELAEAAEERQLAASLRTPAVRFLSLAGNRSLSLDVPTAERHYAKALLLVEADGLERSRLLVRHGHALRQLARFREAAGELEGGFGGLLDAGQKREAAVAMMWHARTRAFLGESERGSGEARALALLRDDGPSPEMVEVLVQAANTASKQLDDHASLEYAERALAMASQLGLAAPPEALRFRGWGRLWVQHDEAGLTDMQQAVNEARERGLGCLGYCLLDSCIASAFWEGAHVYRERAEEALEYARDRGDREVSLAARSAVVAALGLQGEWDAAIRAIVELKPELDEAGDVYYLVAVNLSHLHMLLARGEAEGCAQLRAWLEEKWTRGCLDLEDGAPILIGTAAACIELGDREGARSRLGECRALPGVAENYLYVWDLLPAVRTSLRCGDVQLAADLCKGVEALSPYHRHTLASARALLDEYGGRTEGAAAGFADAAAGWHDIGVPNEEAQALLGQGRCLVALGRAPEAAQPLEQAREIFARLGAKPALAEVDLLLGESPPAPG